MILCSFQGSKATSHGLCLAIAPHMQPHQNMQPSHDVIAGSFVAPCQGGPASAQHVAATVANAPQHVAAHELQNAFAAQPGLFAQPPAFEAVDIENGHLAPQAVPLPCGEQLAVEQGFHAQSAQQFAPVGVAYQHDMAQHEHSNSQFVQPFDFAPGPCEFVGKLEAPGIDHGHMVSQVAPLPFVSEGQLAAGQGFHAQPVQQFAPLVSNQQFEMLAQSTGHIAQPFAPRPCTPSGQLECVEFSHGNSASHVAPVEFASEGQLAVEQGFHAQPVQQFAPLVPNHQFEMLDQSTGHIAQPFAPGPCTPSGQLECVEFSHGNSASHVAPVAFTSEGQLAAGQGFHAQPVQQFAPLVPDQQFEMLDQSTGHIAQPFAPGPCTPSGQLESVEFNHGNSASHAAPVAFASEGQLAVEQGFHAQPVQQFAPLVSNQQFDIIDQSIGHIAQPFAPGPCTPSGQIESVEFNHGNSASHVAPLPVVSEIGGQLAAGQGFHAQPVQQFAPLVSNQQFEMLDQSTGHIAQPFAPGPCTPSCQFESVGFNHGNSASHVAPLPVVSDFGGQLAVEQGFHAQPVQQFAPLVPNQQFEMLDQSTGHIAQPFAPGPCTPSGQLECVEFSHGNSASHVAPVAFTSEGQLAVEQGFHAQPVQQFAPLVPNQQFEMLDQSTGHIAQPFAPGQFSNQYDFFTSAQPEHCAPAAYEHDIGQPAAFQPLHSQHDGPAEPLGNSLPEQEHATYEHSAIEPLGGYSASTLGGGTRFPEHTATLFGQHSPALPMGHAPSSLPEPFLEPSEPLGVHRYLADDAVACLPTRAPSTQDSTQRPASHQVQVQHEQAEPSELVVPAVDLTVQPGASPGDNKKTVSILKPFDENDLPIKPALVRVDDTLLVANVEQRQRLVEWEWARAAAAIGLKTEKDSLFFTRNKELHTSELMAAEIGADQIFYKGWGSDSRGQHALGSSAFILVMLLLTMTKQLAAPAKFKAMNLVVGLLKASVAAMVTLESFVGIAFGKDHRYHEKTLLVDTTGIVQNLHGLLVQHPGFTWAWSHLMLKGHCGFKITSAATHPTLWDLIILLVWAKNNPNTKKVWQYFGQFLWPRALFIAGFLCDKYAWMRSQQPLANAPLLLSKKGKSRKTPWANRLLLLKKMRKIRLHRKNTASSHGDLVPANLQQVISEEFIVTSIYNKKVREAYENCFHFAVHWDPSNYDVETLVSIVLSCQACPEGLAAYLPIQNLRPVLKAEVDPEIQALSSINKLTRVHGYNEIRALSHSLKAIGWPLERFVLPAGVLWKALESYEERVFENGEFWVQNKRTMEKKPQLPKDFCIHTTPLLISVSDQGGINRAGLDYLAFKLNLSLHIQFDPYHRGWNDVKESLKKSNLFKTFLSYALLWNVNYGPFGSKEWHQKKNLSKRYCFCFLPS